MEALPPLPKGSLSLKTWLGRSELCTPVAFAGFFSTGDYSHVLFGLQDGAFAGGSGVWWGGRALG